MADFGGLIRDSNGGFMCAFYGNIVYSNILHAEILALLQGIRLCWKEDLRNIIYYIDSINTIHMVHHGDVFTHHYENEITTIRNT
uniref:Polynucleotidyl transferase, Ribonuclease H fold n=1 Tax=Medicago truncatula TaxID=3880 RepID=A2Q280_MEDTR|nr:Polynucleotidyl transferase, Ribonuclease H fold [Medicago truncatula]